MKFAKTNISEMLIAKKIKEQKQSSFMLIFICFSIIATGSFAQVNLYRDTIVKVNRTSNQLKNAWSPGLNGPIPAEIDLNNDGLMDLIIFDVKTYRLSTFINFGTPGIPDYSYTPEYEKKFPAGLEGWVKTFDYDADGDMDLFSYTGGGIRFDRNDYNAGTGGLQFTLVTIQIQTDYGNNSSNLYSSRVDAPALTDVDSDGDMDIIAFSISGSWFELNINFSMDSTGVPGNLLFYNVPGCWGYFAISSMANKAILPPVPLGCPLLPANPFRPLNPPDPVYTRDGGSTACAIDMEGDGDKDLLCGDILGTNLLYVQNCGVQDSAYACSQDSLFPNYDIPASMNKVAAPYYQDVDNDGAKDLLVGNFWNAGEDIHCFEFYKNTGSNTNNIFSYQTNSFLVNGMIDIGTGAHPAFFDVDGDGKKDLLIANDNYFNNNSPLSRVAYYRNTGTITLPEFTWVTDDFSNLSASGLMSMNLTFGDLDGDADLDMLIGEDQGTLSYYQNITGSPATFVLSQNNYQSIDVGYNAVPQLIDVDRDNLIDLVIGERVGNLNYYHNNGTATSPVFFLTSTAFGNVDVRKATSYAGFSAPILFDTPTGFELLVGSESGYLYNYNNIDGNLGGSFNLVDSMYQNISEPVRAMPAMTDIDGDGKFDLVIGSLSGGVVLYSQNPLLSALPVTTITPYFNLYPNPATDRIIINLGSTERKVVEIWDVTGHLIIKKEINAQQSEIDISNLNSGMYLCKIIAGGRFFSRKFVKE